LDFEEVIMKKLSIPLCLLAAATLAACGNQQVRNAESDQGYTYIGGDLRPGNGRVAYLTDPTGPVDGISWQRMTLNMDDGSQQVLDRRGKQVAMGEHVRLRTNNSLARDPYTFRATP
jgi:hypothetical protein